MATKKKSSGSKTASSAFRKSLSKNKSDFKKTFKTAKSGFEHPDIPKGKYVTKWDAKWQVKDGQKIVNLIWFITKGKYKGETDSKPFFLDSEDEGKKENAWKWLSIYIQKILDVDTAELSDNPEELEDLLKQIKKEKPLTRTSIEPNGDYLNVNVEELLESEDDEEDDEDEDDEEEEEEDEDEEEEEEEEEKPRRRKSSSKKSTKSSKKRRKDDDEEEEEEEDEDDEDEDEEEEEVEEERELATGDELQYKPPKSRKTYDVTVMRINKGKRTALLADEDGNEWKDVSWDDERLTGFEEE